MSLCKTSSLFAHRKQAGVALVSAMLLAALVVSIATAMVFEQQRFINVLENHFSATQARWMGEAAIHWSRAILAEDAKGGSVDHLKENWAIKLPATPFEGGTVRGYITDQQQYCNLNNLTQSAATTPSYADFIKRLIVAVGGAPEASESLIDWIDPDNEITYPSGVESLYYLSQPLPYRAGNQALTEIGNLSRIEGFSKESIARLKQFCTALPESTPVNINTVSPELLALMLPDLSAFQIESIVAARNLKPFDQLSEIGILLDNNKIVLGENQFSVGSHYFMVTSQTQFGKSTIRVEALLKRDGGNWPQLLWKRYR